MKSGAARGGFIASAVCIAVGLALAVIPLSMASSGGQVDTGFKLTGDATGGVIFGGILVLAGLAIFVRALILVGRGRRR